MPVIIGCSGYNYRDWRGDFYPEGLPQSKLLEFYCRHFNSVEINASFYRFPTLKSFKSWYDKTPENFRFSVKANKVITHYKKFKDTANLVSEFYEVTAKGLGSKLDCILFQLPPNMKYDLAVLENIVRQLDPAFKNVLEFRDPGWWNAETYQLLKLKNVIFCVSSFPGLPDDFIKTSDTAYIRLHGKTELYKSNYSDSELESWFNALDKARLKEAFVYFDNTWGGNAIANAKTMQDIALRNPAPPH